WVGVAIGVTVGLFFLSSTAKDQTKCHGDTFFKSADCDYETEQILLFKSDWARPLAYGFNVGLLGGYALALGIDAFLIAYEKIDDTEYGKAKPPAPKATTIFSLSPKLDIGHGRAGLGVGGTF